MDDQILGSLSGAVSEGCKSQLVDGDWYRTTYPDLRDTDPVEHFFAHGLHEDRSPNRWMDPAWYYNVYPDVREAGANAVMHYLEYGWLEKRDPSPWFSTTAYREAALSVSDGRHPFFHFLQQRAATGSGESPIRVNFLVPQKEQNSLLVETWRSELQARGFEVAISDHAGRGWFHAIRPALGRRAKRRRGNPPELTISLDGAGITAAAARHLRENLVIISENPIAAHAFAERVGLALKLASSVTASRAVEAELQGLTRGLGTTWHPEPMSPKYMLGAPSVRETDIVWRLASPLPMVDDITRRLAARNLRIIARSEVPAAHSLAERRPDLVELRADWNTASCLRDCYGSARLALITPAPKQEAEVTSDALAALAAGALPILSYAAAPELLALLGNDLPVPMYKSLDELELIVAHYLDDDTERAAYAAEGRRRVLALPTYSTRIGEVMRRLNLIERCMGIA